MSFDYTPFRSGRSQARVITHSLTPDERSPFT